MVPNVVDATAVDMSNSPPSRRESGGFSSGSEQHWVLPRKMDSGWATSLDPVSANACQDAQQSDVEDEWPVCDVFTPVKNKRISKFEPQNRFEVLVPQEICNVKPELEAFDLDGRQ